LRQFRFAITVVSKPLAFHKLGAAYMHFFKKEDFLPELMVRNKTPLDSIQCAAS